MTGMGKKEKGSSEQMENDGKCYRESIQLSGKIAVGNMW
ncbi:hypothetical protein COLO4_12299 [Corchorus olitorius]|uniref:Uncharacterized protein n=1 Tax=Corchorus olitorius TaxID=93759 RepID=A0A1R3K1A4_9ROSI|nr:hypothetical protein COLO4_12299 [Corchorus olitorius]